ncbi:helix-turn-helix transcriptional regulator [Sinosporangium siamense]|uniref:DNA-binding transcriptional regulator n=1 Tax=Sinosporangium siamense TaxID=1367973 RepID=A0A919RHN9_9ACTN|nr:WYL domain-containing protein [Sinosporangium siamense]GII94075.1 DNA-binding transcriptional regulator [Sinosporangium siamense]
MLETSSRLLALLSLLQSRPDWPGRELAERLGVSTRTIRNDIDRLRELGYPVEAGRGPTGAYRLGPGAKLPPLLLDDEEAVAVAIGLRAGTGVSGIAESSARALTKLDQMLPHRLRRQIAALYDSTSKAPENLDTNVDDPEVDTTSLTAIASAIRDRHWLRFDYLVPTEAEDAFDGTPSAPSGRKLVEPYRLVNWRRRWYLVGRDPEDATWAAYRVDWTTPLGPTGRVFTPCPLPDEDYTAFVLRNVAATGWKVHARITVLAPAGEVLARIHAAVGVVEPLDDETCVLVTGGDSLETIAVYIGMLGLDFRVTSPPGLVTHLRTLGARYLSAVGSPL